MKWIKLNETEKNIWKKNYYPFHNGPLCFIFFQIFGLIEYLSVQSQSNSRSSTQPSVAFQIGLLCALLAHMLACPYFQTMHWLISCFRTTSYWRFALRLDSFFFYKKREKQTQGRLREEKKNRIITYKAK